MKGGGVMVKHHNTRKKEIVDKIQLRVMGKIDRRKYFKLTVLELEMALLGIKISQLAGGTEIEINPQRTAIPISSVEVSPF